MCGPSTNPESINLYEMTGSLNPHKISQRWQKNGAACRELHQPLVIRMRAIGFGVRRCTPSSALEATQGQMDGFFSQLPYKYYLEEITSVGD